MAAVREIAGSPARIALFVHIHGELAAPLAAAVATALRVPDATDTVERLRHDASAAAAAARRLASAVDELLYAQFHGADAPDMLSLRAALRHQINTPLDALRGSIDLLLEQGASCPPLDIALQRAAAACERLSWAVDAVTRFVTEPNCVPALVGAPSPVKGRLLLIDRDQIGRTALARRLEGHGHTVCAVGDEEAALAALPHTEWDLLLLDLGPSLETGIDLLCRLKGRLALRSVPALILGTLTEAEAAGACIAAGADDYVARPLHGPLLYARISATIERKRLRDTERAHLDRLQWELTTARRLQASLLPRSFPPVADLEGHGLTVPARELGADFFDFIPLGDGRLGIAVGDVSGKGVAASFLMGMVRGLLRIAAGTGMQPGACLQRLNAVLCENNDQAMFVTLVYGIIDPRRRTLTYANAGHNPPLLLGTSDPLFLPSTEGPALAVFPTASFQDATVPLAQDALVVLYTDGVVEALDPQGEVFGGARLVAAAAGRRNLAVQDLVEAIIEDVRVFAAGQPLPDDIACAAVRLGGGGHDGRIVPARTDPIAIDLRFAAKPGEVRRLLRIVDGFCLGHGLPDRVARHLALAVDEAVTNVIAHAFGDDAASHEICVRLELDGEAVRVAIEDDGCPFDPRSVRPPSLERPIEELPVGGLGIHIMRSVADEIEYQRDNTVNRLILTKWIAAAGRGGMK